MDSVLDRIVANKRLEIKALHALYRLGDLTRLVIPSRKNFYGSLAAARAAGQPFFIAEFKRKSPSEGWIDQDADLPAQVTAYVEAGARAISVLTDNEFFGGSYQDLQEAYSTLRRLPAADGRASAEVLLLQKDFILDPIQIYLARLHGADIILLIAAILDPFQLEMLKKTAESLGMGVLVEVHELAELQRIRHLDFPVLGVNNRDLKTFRTALNRVNTIAPQAGGRLLVAESGVKDYRDFQVVRNADGFLIGTGLMRPGQPTATDFERRFRSDRPWLFKACGIRTPELLYDSPADFVGLNFSPLSERRIDPAVLDGRPVPDSAVAVFYKNTDVEIRDILARYPFKIVQLYADDTRPEFVRSLRQKVFLAGSIRHHADLQALEKFAADVDLFILDGARPGGGQLIETSIPADFPYPFLLAGGINTDNLDRVLGYKNCLGVDVASGIEYREAPSEARIRQLAGRLATLSR